MFIFAEELVEVPGARENIYKLWINGKCPIDGLFPEQLKIQKSRGPILRK